jgi:mannosyltransferase
MAEVISEQPRRAPRSPITTARARLQDLLADRVVLVGIGIPVLIGLVTGGWGLGRQAFWYDETFEGLLVMHPPVRFAYWIINFETSGAVYHSLLWLWKFLGTDEATLRFPSLVFSVLTLPVVFLIARRAMSVPWSAVAAVLLALSPLWVAEAQEARPYGIFIFGACASTLALLRAVELPSRGRWAVYALVTIFALWSHLMMAFLVMAHVAAMAIHPDVRSWWRPAAVSVAVAAASAIPIPISISRGNPDRWVWITDPTLEGIWEGLRKTASDPGFLTTLAWIALALLGMAVVALRFRRDRRAAWPMVVVTGWLIAPIIVPWVLSFVTRPMYTPRYIYPVLAAVLLLIAYGLSAIRPRVIGAALAVVLAVNGAVGVVTWHRTLHNPDWRAAVHAIVDNGTPADGLAYFYRGPFEPGALYEFRYYLTQVADPEDRPTMIELPASGAPLADRIDQGLAGYDRLWFLGFDLDDPEKASGLAEIERSFALQQDYAIPGLAVRLYSRRTAAF